MYSRPHMDVGCLACLNTSAGSSRDATCVDESFVRAVLGGGGVVGPRECAERCAAQDDMLLK